MEAVIIFSQYFVLMVLPWIFIGYLATKGLYQSDELDESEFEDKMAYISNYLFRNLK